LEDPDADAANSAYSVSHSSTVYISVVFACMRVDDSLQVFNLDTLACFDSLDILAVAPLSVSMYHECILDFVLEYGG